MSISAQQVSISSSVPRPLGSEHAEHQRQLASIIGLIGYTDDIATLQSYSAMLGQYSAESIGYILSVIQPEKAAIIFQGLNDKKRIKSLLHANIASVSAILSMVQPDFCISTLTKVRGILGKNGIFRYQQIVGSISSRQTLGLIMENSIPTPAYLANIFLSVPTIRLIEATEYIDNNIFGIMINELWRYVQSAELGKLYKPSIGAFLESIDTDKASHIDHAIYTSIKLETGQEIATSGTIKEMGESEVSGDISSEDSSTRGNNKDTTSPDKITEDATRNTGIGAAIIAGLGVGILVGGVIAKKMKRK